MLTLLIGVVGALATIDAAEAALSSARDRVYSYGELRAARAREEVARVAEREIEELNEVWKQTLAETTRQYAQREAALVAGLKRANEVLEKVVQND